VVSSNNEGYHESNFNTYRKGTVCIFLKIASITLQVYVLDLLKYHPSRSSLEEYWKVQTGFSYERVEELEEVYFIFDEFQMIYH